MSAGARGWARWAAAAVIIGLLLLNFLFTAAYENHARQAARQAGQEIGRKICTTLSQLAALKPPAGNAAANPSRAYEQELHATLAQLGPDIGCK